uniref:Uncharacterized protein n=1 Tax=uncultured marine crenarchaeote HF4000_APKG7F19 TaxID=455601 RepID=B3T9R2_9ARCH|nr:hypothetical protein ALOHA_HF4000APKG7F19ctg1g35 [uncultured marine crenarchaeote HF4000_APKG7F19]
MYFFIFTLIFNSFFAVRLTVCFIVSFLRIILPGRCQLPLCGFIVLFVRRTEPSLINKISTHEKTKCFLKIRYSFSVDFLNELECVCPFFNPNISGYVLIEYEFDLNSWLEIV